MFTRSAPFPPPIHRRRMPEAAAGIKGMRGTVLFAGLLSAVRGFGDLGMDTRPVGHANVNAWAIGRRHLSPQRKSKCGHRLVVLTAATTERGNKKYHCSKSKSHQSTFWGLIRVTTFLV